MRRRHLALVVAAIGLFIVALNARDQADATLVLEDVTVIDGTGAPPRPGTTIVVRGDRIADMFPTGSRAVPSGARRLATAGRYVIPGLIDSHVHLATTERPQALVEALLRATLLGGVTTVRDMGGSGPVLARLREAARDPAALSPDIHVAAVFAGPTAFWFIGDARVPYFNGGLLPGTAPWLVKVDETTNLRERVAAAKAWGAAGIKIHSDLTRSQVEAIASEARRQRLPVWSHATVGPAVPRDAVDARVVSISHADALVWQGRPSVPPLLFGRPAGMPDAIEQVPFDSAPVRELLARMRSRNVLLEPTLYIGVEAASFAGDDRPRYDRQAAWAAAVTELAHETGVAILAGTDAVGGSSPNLHVELQLLVERAGLSPLEAIRAATFNAARALGLAGEIGSIAVGRRADLVVLDGNPADDIRNTQTVRAVVRRGVVFERTEPMPVPPLGSPPPVDAARPPAP